MFIKRLALMNTERRIFTRRRVKPAWFAREELLDGHVKSQIELKWPKKQAVAMWPAAEAVVYNPWRMIGNKYRERW